MVSITGKRVRCAGLTAAISVLSLSLGGCATVYDVDVDALSNPHAVAPGFAYELVSLNPSISEGSEQFQRAAQLVRKGLTTVGMYEAPAGQPAEVTIAIDFGVGMRQAYAGVTGMNSPIQTGIGPVANVGRIPIPSPSTRPGGYTNYNFRKYLSIVASTGPTLPTARPGSRTELWRVDVSLVDKGDNMDYYLPILAGVASQYVATDTGEKTTQRVSRDDEIVVWIQQGP